MTPSPVPLHTLLQQARISYKSRGDNPEITGITDHSNRVEPGFLFVATKGTAVDSHLFLSDAISRGAVAVVVEQDTPAYDKATVIQVSDSREALGLLSHAFYLPQGLDIPVVAITGTNGKTTTTFMVEAIVGKILGSCGLVGTIEHRLLGHFSEVALNTTPSSLKLAQLVSAMKAHGAQALAMEASSHSLHQKRLAGLPVSVAVLTNITQDHLDYHGTMERYAEAKALLFSPSVLTGLPAFPPQAVIVTDDEYCKAIANRVRQSAPTLRLSTLRPLGPDVEVVARDIVQQGSRLSFIAESRGTDTFPSFSLPASLPIPGHYNAQNALAALVASILVGCSPELALAALAEMPPVPGRLQPVRRGQNFEVLVDYAHTPDALANSLKNARIIAGDQGRVTVVFGCGGDRDRAKRPIMGRIAIELADMAIVTDDNPRTEASADILQEILQGILPYDPQMERHAAIADRATAIRTAISLAKEKDVVLIAGKGHETYQEIHGVRHPFDDVREARDALGANLWSNTPLP
jgi:UDP-N-acetylmuramoyl-L-alanyl-D-glutamate--2,6-diaminopimelate ligase